MFNSLPQTWINVTTHHSDFKELVPEFYMPENKVGGQAGQEGGHCSSPNRDATACENGHVGRRMT